MDNIITQESSNIHIVDLPDKKIILIGTAHISKTSVDLVKATIIEEKPDCVCLELDEKRYETLIKKKKWESLNFLQIIKKKQLTTLLVSLVLSSYQKKLAKQTGISPGSEFVEADKIAKEQKISVSLVDRDARITLKRAWRKTGFFKKLLLMANLFGSFFDKTKIDEKSLSELKNSDVISEMLNELGNFLPAIKTVLIDERDTYIAEKIKTSKGKKIIAVIGAGHVKGIKQALREDRNNQMAEITSLPAAPVTGKIIGWSIPALILLAIFLIGYDSGIMEAKNNILFWIIANGSFCAMGAIFALAHPLTILTAFIAAPFTSLTPVIGAGYVTALVQALICPPSVKEIQNVSEDVGIYKRWWKNKTLKVFLAFLLPGFGSFIGSVVGGFEIIKNLWN